MASANTSNQSAILKIMYGNKIADPLLQATKLLQRCKKETNLGGESYTIQVKVASTSGGSSKFAMAVANQGATRTVRFVVPPKQHYEVASVDGKLMALTESDRGALAKAFKTEMDGARQSFARAMSQLVWGNGGGALGIIDATTNIATAVCKLTDRSDIINFQPGDVIEFSDEDGTAVNPAALRGSPTRLTVV